MNLKRDRNIPFLYIYSKISFMEEKLNNSDKNADNLLNSVTLKECSDLVPFPQADNSRNSNWTCGDKFDVEAACRDNHWCNRYYVDQGVMGYDNYPGYCAASVRQHLIKGGIKYPSPCGSGYNMRQTLSGVGFNRIFEKNTKTTREEMREWTKKFAQKGDVCVMTKPGEEPGHVCMFNGTYWVSDCIQKRDGALAYKYSNNVEVWRFKECESVTQSETPSIVNKQGLIDITYTITNNTGRKETYIFGSITINSDAQIATACLPGLKGNSKNKNCFLIGQGTYDVNFINCEEVLQMINDKTYADEEFASYLTDLKDKVEVGKLYLPVIINATVYSTVNSKSFKKNVYILPGRGSLSTTGNLIIGAITTECKTTKDFYFGNIEPKINEGVSTLKGQYAGSWNAYKSFWEYCYKKYQDLSNQKIGTIKVLIK